MRIAATISKAPAEAKLKGADSVADREADRDRMAGARRCWLATYGVLSACSARSLRRAQRGSRHAAIPVEDAERFTVSRETFCIDERASDPEGSKLPAGRGRGP